MTSKDVINWTEFDPKKIVFSKTTQQNAHRGIFATMSYPGTGKDKGFKIMTPVVTLPFGVSRIDFQGKNISGDESPISNYGFDFSFAGHDTDPSVAKFLQIMRAFDECILDAAVENQETWFGYKKALTRDSIAVNHRPMVKESMHAEKNYPPVTKTKTKARPDGGCMVHFFNVDRTPASVDDIQKGSRVRMLLNLDRVWFMNRSSFGVTWRPEQILICSSPPPRDICVFKDDVVLDDAAAPADNGHMDLE
jgi:hypothetical protein